MSRSDELVEALLGSRAVDERPKIAGITTGATGRTWDAFGSTHARDVTGDTVAFVTLEDGTVIVADDQPDGALDPLADVVEEMVKPPYRAAGVRSEEDVWTVVAEKVSIVGLPEVEGDVVDFTSVNGEQQLEIDGEPGERSLPVLESLAAEHEDVSIRAERVDGHLFAVDVFPL